MSLYLTERGESSRLTDEDSEGTRGLPGRDGEDWMILS